MLGTRIGSYLVVREIGAGGMGKIYEAVHEQLGRRAAVKVLHAHLVANGQLAARFLNEGRAASMIEHPGIVQIFELGQLDGGPPYTIMELLRGESLRDRMDRAGGPMSVAPSVRIIRQVGDALVAAHATGIVHRDLKPDNVMIVPDPAAEGGERTKLLDFGIAKLAEGLLEGAPRTQTGAILGSPLYMAPEQCQGARLATDRTDVYAVGAMLYEMLGAAPPIGGTTVAELLVGHIAATPIPLRERNPAVPDALAALVHRMLAKIPEERPAMNEVIAYLDPFLREGAGLASPSGAGHGSGEPAHTPIGYAERAHGPVPVQFGRFAVVAGSVVALVAGAAVAAWIFAPEAPLAGDAVSTTDSAPIAPAPDPAPPADQPIVSPGAGGPESRAPESRVPESRVPSPSVSIGEPEPSPSPRARKPEVPLRPRQEWEGDFLAVKGSGTRVCDEGRTDMKVVISSVKGLRVNAVLEFHHGSGHWGSYHLSGTYEPGGRRVSLRASKKWIDIDVHDNDDVEDFVPVGMDGRISADGKTFEGRMTSSPCTTFHMHPH
jgi:serine/threonine protein kinase